MNEFEHPFLAFGGMTVTSAYDFLEKWLLNSLAPRAIGPTELTYVKVPKKNVAKISRTAIVLCSVLISTAFTLCFIREVISFFMVRK